jgi:glycosyltransferase involved in cell wall biosynthesis
VSNDTQPLVSVGVTSYRKPEALRSALGILVAQTYRNLEIVVSDDDSAMPAVEAVLDEFSALDQRICVFRQQANIGAKSNHLFVAQQASGDYFLWLHEDDLIPDDYIERCVARFSDGPNIALVGARCDAFWEGRHWYTYKNYSDLGEDTYVRLGGLIAIAYSEPAAFQQYFLGVFSRESLLASLWKDREYHYKEKFSLLFRVAESGFLHFADDVTLEKNNFVTDSRKWQEARYIDRPRRYKFAGARLEKLLPITANIFATVGRSDNLGSVDKLRLFVWCSIHFAGALTGDKNPAWKRILRVPLKLVGAAARLIRRIVARLTPKID